MYLKRAKQLLPVRAKQILYLWHRNLKRHKHRRRVNTINWNLELAREKSWLVLDKSPSQTRLGSALDYSFAWVKAWIQIHVALLWSPSRVRPVFINLEVYHRFKKLLSALKQVNHQLYIVDSADFTISAQPKFIPSNSKWFATQIVNPSLLTGKLIPIGVPRLRHAYKYGEQENYEFVNFPQNGKILVGPFSPSNPVRKTLLAKLDTEVITVVTVNLSPQKYSTLASKFDFVCCPPGSVPDTYRLWETLNRGRIPICLKSGLTIELKGYCPQIVLVDSFDEMWSWSLDFSRELANQHYFLPQDVAPLSPHFWYKSIFQVDVNP